LLSITDAKKSFGGNLILNGVSVSVEKGQAVALIGPSGSGKTTLLRLISFLERADTGSLDFGEIHTELKSAHKKTIQQVRRQLGFVFQNYNLFANKTVLGNVTEGLITARHIPRAEAHEIAMAALEKVGMANRAGAYPSELSGGQQQRVGIARAIAPSPEVILFDEPTSALDPELVDEVLNVIRMLAEEGTTMLIVTHEIEFARGVADHAVFMEEGQVVEEGPAASMLAKPTQERTKQFLRRYLSPEYSI